MGVIDADDVAVDVVVSEAHAVVLAGDPLLELDPGVLHGLLASDFVGDGGLGGGDRFGAGFVDAIEGGLHAARKLGHGLAFVEALLQGGQDFLVNVVGGFAEFVLPLAQGGHDQLIDEVAGVVVAEEFFEPQFTAGSAHRFAGDGGHTFKEGGEPVGEVEGQLDRGRFGDDAFRDRHRVNAGEGLLAGFEEEAREAGLEFLLPRFPGGVDLGPELGALAFLVRHLDDGAGGEGFCDGVESVACRELAELWQGERREELFAGLHRVAGDVDEVRRDAPDGVALELAKAKIEVFRCLTPGDATVDEFDGGLDALGSHLLLGGVFVPIEVGNDEFPIQLADGLAGARPVEEFFDGV